MKIFYRLSISENTVCTKALWGEEERVRMELPPKQALSMVECCFSKTEEKNYVMGRKRLSLIPDQMKMISSTIHIITAKRGREGSQEIYAIIKMKSEIPDLLGNCFWED